MSSESKNAVHDEQGHPSSPGEGRSQGDGRRNTKKLATTPVHAAVMAPPTLIPSRGWIMRR